MSSVAAPSTYRLKIETLVPMPVQLQLLNAVPTMPDTPASDDAKISCSKLAKFACSPGGICSLPVELLTRIFTLGAGSDYPYEDTPFLLKPNQDYYPPPPSFQLLASHVCQRWRHIALRTPSLWTTLHLREPVHIARARTYLERCSTFTTYLLDILVDTVAAEEHIPGVTLCREEIVQVFELIIPHVTHWKSFHLKVRDNGCKLQARHYLSTCGGAPCLETLQLYHFEDYGTSQNLYLATYRPPVVVFSNDVPMLRNVSLIGVNLPWLDSPYLMSLHKLEMALHPDKIRPPYDSWDRMLRHSSQLQSLYLHYSGPQSESGGEPNSAWAPPKEKIALNMLSDLKFTDLDPDYLCGVLERLHLPSVRKMSWDLPEQDFSPFIDLLTRRKACPTDGSASKPPRRRSKVSISSLLSDSDPKVPEARLEIIFAGPLPYLDRIEVLVITALECSLLSWQTLLGCLEGLKQLEVDFRRVGAKFWGVFRGVVEVDRNESLRVGSAKRVHLPNLKMFKVAGITGSEIKKEMKRRARKGGLCHWIIRWSPALKDHDAVLEQLVEDGLFVGEGTTRLEIRVDTYFEDEEEEVEEEDSGP